MFLRKKVTIDLDDDEEEDEQKFTRLMIVEGLQIFSTLHTTTEALLFHELYDSTPR